MTGSKRVVHWTSETWCECSEIAGSPQAQEGEGLFCLKTELKILCYCLLTVKKTTIDGGAGLPGCRIFHDDIWTDAEHGGVVIHLRLDISHTLYAT
jgi:hypothetical protein